MAREPLKDPRIEWEEINTPHFTIIFNKEKRNIAKEYARLAEESYNRLVYYFTQSPVHTTVLIDDSTDLANGSSTFFPSHRIVINLALPTTDMAPLSDHSDWGRTLMFHEYTHSLTFNPRGSLAVAIKYLLGDVFYPNVTLPRWFQEGIAIQNETLYTRHGGRLQSPMTSAFIRAMNWKRETLDRINELNIPLWPYGHRPYIIGALLVNEVLSKASKNCSGLGCSHASQSFANKLLVQYSETPPYQLDRLTVDNNQPSWKVIYDRLKKRLIKKVRLQKQKIKSQGHLSAVTWPDIEDDALKILISPDGKKALVRERVRWSRHARGRWVLYKKWGQKWQRDKVLVSTFKTLSASWLEDSSGFVFDKLDRVHSYNLFYDLYLYRLKSGSIERLTTGARAHEPDVKKNKVVFIKNTTEHNNIYTLDLKTKKICQVYKSPSQEKIVTPQWIGMNQILFIRQNRRGLQRIYKLSMQNTCTSRQKVELQILWPQHQSVTTLQVHRKKAFFVSSRSGVPNLYEASWAHLKQVPLALTNSTTAITSGAAINNKVYFTELTSEGIKGFSAQRQVFQPPFTPPVVPFHLKKPKFSLKNPAPKIKIQKYNPLHQLHPRHWLPTAHYFYGNHFILNAQTTMSDPVDLHAYKVSVGTDTFTKQFNYDLEYQNRTMPVIWTLNHSQSNEPLPEANHYYEHHGTYLNTSFFLPFLSQYFRGSARATYLTTTPKNLRKQGATNDSNPEEDPPEFNKLYRSGVTLGLRYSRLKPDFSAWGYRWGVSHTRYIPFEKALSYDRTFASYEQLLNLEHFQFNGQIRWAHSNLTENIEEIGDRTLGGHRPMQSSNNQFLMRGYPTGHFFGTHMVNSNFNFTFKLADIQKGYRLFPIFLGKASVNLFFDSVALDGNYYKRDRTWQSTDLNQIYHSTGVELLIETNIGYHLPVNVILGLYYGLNKEAGGELIPFASFALF